MYFYGDFHTHTVASGHAYSTIDENVKAAGDRGLFAMATTDHAKNMPGAPIDFYFNNLHVVPDYLHSVRVLKGIEANIIDYDGSLDVDSALLSRLDIRIASMHTLTLKGKPSVRLCTDAYMAAAENPDIDIIGHSGQVYYKYDYEPVIKKCAENGTLIEINNASFYNRPDSIDNIREILSLCRKHLCMTVVNSDAHFHEKVGDMTYVSDLMDEISFPCELVMNSSVDRIKDYLKLRNISF